MRLRRRPLSLSVKVASQRDHLELAADMVEVSEDYVRVVKRLARQSERARLWKQSALVHRESCGRRKPFGFSLREHVLIVWLMFGWFFFYNILLGLFR